MHHISLTWHAAYLLDCIQYSPKLSLVGALCQTATDMSGGSVVNLATLLIMH